MLFLSKKTAIYWDFFKKKEKKEKAFPWLATSQNLPGVQARHRFYFLFSQKSTNNHLPIFLCISTISPIFAGKKKPYDLAVCPDVIFDGV